MNDFALIRIIVRTSVVLIHRCHFFSSNRDFKVSNEELEKANKQLNEIKNEIQKPKLYNVIIHNDDCTPMDFVVEILQEIFQKEESDAYRLMLQVHNLGSCICGAYSNDIAETKIALVKKYSELHKHQLQCSIKEHKGEV